MVLERRQKWDRIENTAVNEDDEHDEKRPRKILDKITIRNDLIRCLLAECYGTFLVSAFAHGALAQDVVSSTCSTFNTAIVLGLSLSLSIYSAFGVSGGHLNLSLSVGLAAGGSFPWKRIPLYFVAQLIGGFLGAAVTYGIYQDAFDAFDGGTRQVLGENGTAVIFATFPQPYLSVTAGFFEQVFITALLLAVAQAVTDERNSAPPLDFTPIFFGLIVFTISMSYGVNAGAPLNPSVDISGRIFLTVAGYGREVWTPGGVHWWWISVLGSVIGSSLGSWCYVLAIRLHHDTQTGMGKLEYGNSNPVSESHYKRMEDAEEEVRENSPVFETTL